MKARIKSTGRICQVICIEKTKDGIVYDIRLPGITKRKVNERLLEIINE
jgi:hypothetical protein